MSVHLDRKSVGQEYHYEVKIEELKPWDKFVSNVAEAASDSEKHTNFIQKSAKFLKILSIIICFGVVLGGGVVSKGALLFMVAQTNIKAERRPLEYCSTADPNHQVLPSQQSTIAWLW